MKPLLVYLFIINAAGFITMLADKIKAKKNRWRIPEATLLSIAAIGGSLGTYCAMQLFRHKTKHLKFSLGVPVLLAVQAVLLVIACPILD